LLSYLACSQTWLNLLVDHHHVGYNTKLPIFIFISQTPIIWKSEFNITTYVDKVETEIKKI
jgi:hypothetical protein